MTTIVVASTLYGLATAVTVLDNEPSSTDDRRLLVVSNNALMAEIVPDLNELDGFDAVADRFDDVVSLNELISHSTGRSARTSNPLNPACVSSTCASDGTSHHANPWLALDDGTAGRPGGNRGAKSAR